MIEKKKLRHKNPLVNESDPNPFYVCMVSESIRRQGRDYVNEIHHPRWICDWMTSQFITTPLRHCYDDADAWFTWNLENFGIHSQFLFVIVIFVIIISVDLGGFLF